MNCTINQAVYFDPNKENGLAGRVTLGKVDTGRPKILQKTNTKIRKINIILWKAK